MDLRRDNTIKLTIPAQCTCIIHFYRPHRLAPVNCLRLFVVQVLLGVGTGGQYASIFDDSKSVQLEQTKAASGEELRMVQSCQWLHEHTSDYWFPLFLLSFSQIKCYYRAFVHVHQSVPIPYERALLTSDVCQSDVGCVYLQIPNNDVTHNLV